MRFLANLLHQIHRHRNERTLADREPVADHDGLLAAILEAQGLPVALNMLEIGALPFDGHVEPFYRLLKTFPSSRLSGLEIDPRLCEELNRKAAPNVRYYPCALGKAAETRRLYETAHPMCTSLYRPDERYADVFNNLDETRLKNISEIQTISLDQFVRDQWIGEIDLIKIDIQGAELEVFQGGTEVLRNLLFVICEVEFVPMYVGQPLYGDVDAWLRKHGLMLHKFLGMAGRVMKPLMVDGSANNPVQFLWTDAVFIRDLFSLETMSDQQLLKLAVLVDLYESKDVALYLLRRYDARKGTGLATTYLSQLNASGSWRTFPAENHRSSGP